MVKLVRSHLHKDKHLLVVFFLIITLSTLLLHAGFFVGDYPKMYDEKIDKLGKVDSYIFISGEPDVDVKDGFEGNTDIEAYSIKDIIQPSDGFFTNNKNDKVQELEGRSYFQKLGDYGITSGYNFVERDDNVEGNKIYMNMYSAYSNSICVGDKVYFDLKELGTYEFTIAGLYEDLISGYNFTFYSFMVEEDFFSTLKAKSDELTNNGSQISSNRLVMVRFKEGINPESGMKKVTDGLIDDGHLVTGYLKALFRTSYTGLVKILSAFMTVFSVLIIIICLVMIIFTINNNIKRDIRNIGALRAVGHTAKQIRLSVMLEYLVVGTAGTLAGIALSYALYPVLEYALIRQLSGMVWVRSFCVGHFMVVLGSVLAVIIIATFIATTKLKALHPATALRFGLESNSFKKNHLPLAKTKGRLNTLLAAKSTLQNMSQNLIIAGIVIAVSFVTMFSSVLLYNTRVDISAFQRVLQGEVPDAYVTIKAEDDEDLERITQRINDIPGVSQAYVLQYDNTNIGEYDIIFFYVTHPEYVECGVYEGKMAKEDNEAVIGKILADKLGVKIGDEIVVTRGRNKAAFVITGYQQAVYGLGERVYVTYGGAKKLDINVTQTDLRLRLEDPSTEKVDEVLEQAEQILGDRCLSTENYYEYQRSDKNMPVYAVKMIVLLLIILNLLIIYLVIRLLLKTVFIKKEREFGIKKAVGFTNRQLRFQITLSLLPASIIATITGALLGYFFFNPVLTLIFSGYGVEKVDLLVYAPLMFITIVAVNLVMFGLTYFMSGKMKKVSAYNLIQEG